MVINIIQLQKQFGRKLALGTALGVAATVMLQSATAATLTWTNGSGTWNNSSANWSGSTWADGSDAIFNTAGGTVTANASGFGPNNGPTLGSLTLGVSGVTITGDATLTVGGANAINLSTGANGPTATITNQLNLSSAATFTSSTQASMTLSGDIHNNGYLLTVINTKGTVNLTGVISGTGGLTLGGTGTGGIGSNYYLNANNSFTGAVTISGNQIINVASLANGGVNSSFGAGTGAITLGVGGVSGTLVFNSATNQSTNRLLTIVSSATATLTSNGTGAVNFTNTGNATATSGNYSKPILFNGTSTAANTFAEVLADYSTSGGKITSVTKSGIGTWILSGVNTYTGATNVSGGRLVISGGLGNTAIGVTVAGSTLAVQSGGTINLGSTGTAGAGATVNLAARTIFDMSGDGIAGIAALRQGSGFSGNALTAAGATFKFDLLDTSTDQLMVTSGASISGTNIIVIDATDATALTVGNFDLITAASGLTGTFQFTDGSTQQSLTVGGVDYTLSLSNTGTAETLTVTSNPVPEVASLSLLGLGALAIITRRKTQRR